MADKKPYKPINCYYYDYLEIYAMRKTLVEIKLKDEDNAEFTISTRISNLKAIDGEEFMYLENGSVYRLDKLISINPTT